MTTVLDLASLAVKIEEADQALQQETPELTGNEKELLVFCQRLIAIIQVVIAEKRSTFPTTGWPLVVMSILVKVILTVRAAHTLGAAGHAREIAALHRSALESLITAMFIAQDDSATRAGRWVKHAVIIKAHLLMKEPHISTSPEDLKTKDEIEAEAKTIKPDYPNPFFWASGLGKGGLRQLAIDVGMQWYYDAVYWSGSQATHGSAISVEGYVGTASGIPLFELGLSTHFLRGEIAVCCDILVRALVLMNTVLKLELDKLCAEVAAEYMAAFGEEDSDTQSSG